MIANPCKINISSFDLSKAITFSGIFSKIKLSPSARLVLRCLVDFWNPEKGLVYPGQKKIAEYTGMTRESVNKCINELRKENLVLSSGAAGEKLKYCFTPIFFELVKTSQGNDKKLQWCEKSSQGGSEKSSHHEQIIHEQNIKQINNNKSNNKNSEIVILSNGFKVKTDFQRDYIDVFEKLTSEQVDSYKLLEGFEREKWLIKKRQEFKKQDETKQINEPTANLQDLIEFKDRKKALQHCATTFKLSPKTMSKDSLAHKIADFWGFTDQDIRNYLLYGEV